MELSPAYYQWEQETLQKGRHEGRHEGHQDFLKSLLTHRFGTLDKTLSELLTPLLQLSPTDATQLLLQASREELLAQFGKTPRTTRRLVQKKSS